MHTPAEVGCQTLQGIRRVSWKEVDAIESYQTDGNGSGGGRHNARNPDSMGSYGAQGIAHQEEENVYTQA